MVNKKNNMRRKTNGKKCYGSFEIEKWTEQLNIILMHKCIPLKREHAIGPHFIFCGWSAISSQRLRKHEAHDMKNLNTYYMEVNWM